MTIRPVAFCVGMLLAMGAQAQVFKCVDANGKTVYSQSACPSGTKSSVVSSKPALSPAAPAAKTTAEQEADFRKRQKSQQDAEKKSTDKEAADKEAAENCARARGQVAQLAANTRIAQYSDKGDRYYLDDSQIVEERNKALAMVSQWCK